MSGDLVTLRQAAEALGCSPGTIRRLVDSGQLPAIRLGGEPGGHRRIDIKAALEAWRVPTGSQEGG